MPFVLHLLPNEEAHLCPVRALAEWLGETNITTGYLFPKIASGDRVAINDNHPMVCTSVLVGRDWADVPCYRHLSSSWSCSGTTCLTLVLILTHTVPIHSGVVGANTWPISDGGLYVKFVIGEVGVLSSPT